jgi:hypothetical protein
MVGIGSRSASLPFLITLAGIVFATPACLPQREPAAAAFLNDLRELAIAPSLTVDKIQSTLAVAFIKDENSSHEYVTFLVGRPLRRTRSERLIKLVDCRVPTAQNRAMTEPFLLIELQAGDETSKNGQASKAAVELMRTDVVARFGQPDVFEPAAPQNPQSAGSLIYKIGKRSLWFAVGRQDEDRVISVSIHPVEDVR